MHREHSSRLGSDYAKLDPRLHAAREEAERQLALIRADRPHGEQMWRKWAQCTSDIGAGALGTGSAAPVSAKFNALPTSSPAGCRAVSQATGARGFGARSWGVIYAAEWQDLLSSAVLLSKPTLETAGKLQQ
ncbi:unnamed protein product [Prorocentrum cordatum]|uniref:Uncharacterized protein n=1 Tax=Prorocentrum cordatum TaxID=2364126 RepID=A0ABN9SZ19_9DINO|nr:unnamed protein product [Polarella glacialis]